MSSRLNDDGIDDIRDDVDENDDDHDVEKIEGKCGMKKPRM